MDYGLVCHLGAGVAAPTSLQLPKLEVSVLLSGTVTEVNRLGNFPNKDKVLGHESHSYLQQVSTATPVLHNQSSCRSHHPLARKTRASTGATVLPMAAHHSARGSLGTPPPHALKTTGLWFIGLKVVTWHGHNTNFCHGRIDYGR